MDNENAVIANKSDEKVFYFYAKDDIMGPGIRMSEMKLQNVQVALYFGSDINSEIFWICKDLIGDERSVQPIIFPFGHNPSPQSDMIMAIIPMASGVQIQVGASFVIINTNNVEDVVNEGRKIIDVFSARNIAFRRVGVVSNYSFPHERIQPLSKKIFSRESFPELDFQYARLSIENIDDISSKTNLWRRYFTALDSTPDLLAETDINTPISEEHQIDQEFLAKFVEASQRLSRKCFEEDDAI